ncbi:MAG TPA: hypothetical protein DCL48_02925, partial [Alphaproteobacteria bacterium]|nr:hypothetical protein [Alphaproteobacteria bacterium]
MPKRPICNRPPFLSAANSASIWPNTSSTVRFASALLIWPFLATFAMKPAFDMDAPSDLGHSNTRLEQVEQDSFQFQAKIRIAGEPPMKIVTFTENHRTRLGVLREDGVVDLATHAPQLPHTMISFLRMGPAAMEEARAAADKAASTIPLARCQLLAPVPRPTKVLAIGLNYADHVREGNRALPEHQVWFAKQPTSIIGPGAPIVIPSVSEMIDFEGELAYVIGRRARKVPKERAHEV